MWGKSKRWCPWTYVRERHADVQVVTTKLPGQLQGCVDPVERVIWLDEDMSRVQRRSTLAFELGQLQNGPTPQEPHLAVFHRRAAEDWAARMLIPTDDLLDALSLSGSLDEIAEMLHVDVPTLRSRLRGLTDDEQDAIMSLVERWRIAAV